jgi:3-hydroxyacyl-[acyl-carrier-protein] dehydratase
MPVLARIGEARFKQMVLPGQTIFAEVTLDDELDRAYVMSGRIRVENKVAVRVSFSCMLAGGKEANG